MVGRQSSKFIAGVWCLLAALLAQNTRKGIPSVLAQVARAAEQHAASQCWLNQRSIRMCRKIQLVDSTLREPINSQHLFQHLESCQPTPIPGPGTWQPKRLKPSSRESLEVEILRTITSISAKFNEKTLITC